MRRRQGCQLRLAHHHHFPTTQLTLSEAVVGSPGAKRSTCVCVRGGAPLPPAPPLRGERGVWGESTGVCVCVCVCLCVHELHARVCAFVYAFATPP